MSPVASPEAPTRTPTRPGGQTSRRSRWASVGTRGRALHMRQTAQTVKLSAGAVLPPTSGGLIVPGMDVGRRRKERHVTPPKASPTPRVGRAPRGPIEGRRDREHIRTVVVPDHDDLALRLADRIVEVIARETVAKGRCVLGLATGSTPLGIYRELIRRHQAGEVDFSRVVTFNLDEYYPMPADSPHSYRRYMWENLFAHVNIRPEQVHVPDGGVPRETLAEHCLAYERAIVEAGGIDFQMLGIGKSGHIGFNEPGSSPDERTRLVTLDTVTRKDASGDFFGEDNVPREAITMGVATILEAREIALIATGEHKADIVARAVEGEVSQDVAATFLQRHANATAYLDLAAAAELTRIKTPWVLGPVEWTPELTERAVVWAAERTGKAILKLTARDYAEHHLSPLLSKHGAAGPINGVIFNRLRDKIRGRRKLPTRKSVIVFSPHPDDDVISMGGLLRKLWENENTIVVAYMTSGNIAVFDHDVRRHLDFVERAATTLGLERAAAQRVRGEVEASFERKAPGDVDLPAVQDLKRVIRESEAVAALESGGLPPRAARVLNLPFYRTRQGRQDPICPGDVAVRAGTTNASSGSASRRGTWRPRPGQTGWGCPSTSQWKRTAFSHQRRQSDERDDRPRAERGSGGGRVDGDFRNRAGESVVVARDRGPGMLARRGRRCPRPPENGGRHDFGSRLGHTRARRFAGAGKPRPRAGAGPRCCGIRDGAASATSAPVLHSRRLRRRGRRDGAAGRQHRGRRSRGHRARDRSGAGIRRRADRACIAPRPHVTEVRDAEARAASRRLLATSERELQRIVLDMHDGPVQDIFAALSQLQVLERALAADPTAAQRARQAVQLLERALGEIRNFIGAFRPPGFERRELGQIIEGLAVQHETLTEQAVELELPGELGDCALPTKNALHRILQEALANGHRHSGATRQRVSVERRGLSIALTVSDDGRGFEPQRVLAREEDVGVEGGHFGLRGIQDRVEMLGGTFTLESAPGRGTSLTVALPAE